MVRFILFLLKPFRRLIESMGADYEQFIRILRLKLTLDNRRASNLTGKSGDKIKNSLVWQLVMLLVMGLFTLFMLVFIQSPFTLYFVSHSMLMASMAMLIISEFSRVLLDTADNSIVLPLPIKGCTLSLARNAHVLVYLTFTALSLMAAPLVYVGFRFGALSALVFLVSIVLNVVFTLSLSNVLYLGIVNVVRGEKLKNLLMYFQIFVAILFMATYQIAINVVDRSDFASWVLEVNATTFLLPPAYFAGFADAVANGNFTNSNSIFFALALVLPFMLIYLTSKYLTPLFNRKLADLEQGERASMVTTQKGRREFIPRVLSYLFMCVKQERSAFIMMWRMSGRERQFLQILLPNFAYVVIFTAMPLLKDKGGIDKLVDSNMYLPFLYMCSLLSASLPSAMQVGGTSHVGWLFRSLPMESPALLFRGFIKSTFAKFVLPFYSIVGAATIAVWGSKAIIDVLIVFVAIYMSTLVVYVAQTPLFPFAGDKKVAQGGAIVLRVFVFIIAAVLLGFLHGFMGRVSMYLPLVLLPIYLGLTYATLRYGYVSGFAWSKIDLVNRY